MPLVCAQPEMRLTVRRILFEALRELCEDLDMPEGACVRFRRRTPGLILLQTATGRIVALEADWGRFIEVETRAEDRTPDVRPERRSRRRPYAGSRTMPRAGRAG